MPSLELVPTRDLGTWIMMIVISRVGFLFQRTDIMHDGHLAFIGLDWSAV
jgi:hypothetical protein